MATTVLYSSWVKGKNHTVHMFLRNRFECLHWIVIQSAELLLFLNKRMSWWDNAPAGETCFYFSFLLSSPPHSVFSLISAFISFPMYFLFLPPLGLGGILHVPLPSHFTSAGSFQQVLCKWAICKLQLTEHRGCKPPHFMRGHLRHKLR